jgi:thiamin-phosphate kinase
MAEFRRVTHMGRSFPIGKVPAEFIEMLWRQHAYKDSGIIVGPGIGRDVAVLDVGSSYLVAKSDPITFTTDHIGWYAVQVNTNDVACSGADPEWFLATLLLPEASANEEQVESIFNSIHLACETVGAALVGGHSEVTHGINRPIVLGCMLGRVAKDRLITSAGARPGDAVAVTVGLPIEGTAILGREHSNRLTSEFGEAFVERCQQLLFDPGISVLPAARIARDLPAVHALHDPTEGGLATGLWELAQASSVDLEIIHEAIPILPEGRMVCDYFEIDPTKTLASGSLVMAIAKEGLGTLENRFAEAGIAFHPIGQVLEGNGQVRLMEGDQSTTLVPPDRDEIARLFD